MKLESLYIYIFTNLSQVYIFIHVCHLPLIEITLFGLLISTSDNMIDDFKVLDHTYMCHDHDHAVIWPWAMLLFMHMNLSWKLLSCDALFIVTSPKTRNVSLLIILVRSQNLIMISGSVFSMLEYSLYSPQFVLCSEWLTLRTKGFLNPQPYCSVNYITTLFYKHPCIHETIGRSAGPVLTHHRQCWPSAGPALWICLVLAGMWFRVTCVIHFSPLSHGGNRIWCNTPSQHTGLDPVSFF